MKNNLTLYSLLALALGVTACQNKEAFTLEGNIKNTGNIKKVYLLRADTSQVSVIDSAELSSGRFKFKNQSTNANLFKLRAGETIFDLIAKNGDDISFETDLNDQSHAYQVKGSQESDKIKEFNTFSNQFGEKNTKIVTEFQGKAQATKNQDSLLKVYQPVFDQNMADYSQQVLKFIADNKKSLAAFYAAMSLDPYKYEPQLVAYADDIKDEFKDNAAVNQFKRQMTAIKPLSVGHAAPMFTANSIEGKPVSLASFKGKYVMIDFWASWCGPCRQENPNVVRLYNEYKSKGFNILGVSLDEDKGDWQAAVAKDKLTWQQVSDLKKWDGATAKLYHIEAIPSNFILDPQGNIVAKNITGKNLEEFLNKTFNKL
jgi:thiol-disulfide isomerase/thioredoxin